MIVLINVLLVRVDSRVQMPPVLGSSVILKRKKRKKEKKKEKKKPDMEVAKSGGIILWTVHARESRP